MEKEYGNMKTFEEIYELTKVLNLTDTDVWVRHSDDGEVHFYLNANDFFYWGCADMEEISFEDIALFKRCIEDLTGFKPTESYMAESLFMCRKRGMRPQSPVLGTYQREFPRLYRLIVSEFPERDE
jgi:hypothetical protein